CIWLMAHEPSAMTPILPVATSCFEGSQSVVVRASALRPSLRTSESSLSTMYWPLPASHGEASWACLAEKSGSPTAIAVYGCHWDIGQPAAYVVSSGSPPGAFSLIAFRSAMTSSVLLGQSVMPAAANTFLL